MSTILAEVNASVGDVYLITAGMIHAIGAGCTIVEVQEPTDFTIQPENWCGDVKISDGKSISAWINPPPSIVLIILSLGIRR